MKKVFLSLLMFVVFLPMNARVRIGADRSHPVGNPTLNVVSSIGIPFWIYVDDVLQTEFSVASISLQNVPAGDVYVRVELENQDHNSMGRFVTVTDRSLYLTIVQQGGFFGFQTNFAGVHPQLTQPLLVSGQPQPSYPVPGGFQPMRPCMDEADFSEAVKQIQKESFDSSRLSTAKQIVSSNRLCSRQIVEICQKFSFESNRLEFAKYAYPYCSDQNKYYMVNEAFSYESSKRELDAFIKGM